MGNAHLGVSFHVRGRNQRRKLLAESELPRPVPLVVALRRGGRCVVHKLLMGEDCRICERNATIQILGLNSHVDGHLFSSDENEYSEMQLLSPSCISRC